MANLNQMDEFLELLQWSMACYAVDEKGRVISKINPLDMFPNYEEKRTYKEEERKVV